MSFLSNFIKLQMATGFFNWPADSVGIMLVDSTNDATADHEFIGDIPTLGELSGTNYSRLLVGNLTATVDLANDRVILDGDDVLWSLIDAGTAAAAILYKDSGSDATRPFICKIDTGGFPILTTGANLAIQWNAAGVLQIS